MHLGLVSPSIISEDARWTYHSYAWHHVMYITHQFSNRLLNGSFPWILARPHGIPLPRLVMIRIRIQHRAISFLDHRCAISKVQTRALCVNHHVSYSVSPSVCNQWLITPFASLAAFEDWLALDNLEGKHIIVRISGFTSQNGNGTTIPDGNIASTIGKPIHTGGVLPEIEVKAMVPGARPMSVPICFLKPVHPGGDGEEAIIIAGEHSGTLGIVGNTEGPLWDLLVFDGMGDMIVVTIRPENLVRTLKRKVRRSTP